MAGQKREARLRSDDPAIHDFPLLLSKTWMPGTRPGMTARETKGRDRSRPFYLLRRHHPIRCHHPRKRMIQYAGHSRFYR
jgi:hypothetical protein